MENTLDEYIVIESELAELNRVRRDKLSRRQELEKEITAYIKSTEKPAIQYRDKIFAVEEKEFKGRVSAKTASKLISNYLIDKGRSTHEVEEILKLQQKEAKIKTKIMFRGAEL